VTHHEDPQSQPAPAPLTDEELREAEEMLLAVAPFPWRETDARDKAFSGCDVRDAVGVFVADCGTSNERFEHPHREAHRAFIAAAPVLLRRLLAEVRRLRAEASE
jgi:hypothetical protein